MKTSIKIEGLAELDRALSELPKATQRSTLMRVLKESGEQMRSEAERLAPRDTGDLAQSIELSTSIANKVGSAEFAAVMKAGGTRAEAVGAMRDARRAAQGSGKLNSAQVYIGPKKASSKRTAIKAMVQEFGSIKQAPQPYMRPAFDATKEAVVRDIGDKLGGAIERAAKRVAARAARKATGGK